MKIATFLIIISILFCFKIKAQKTEIQLLQYLQNYRGGNFAQVYPCSFKQGLNFTDTVKRRLLSLLRNEWTNEEMKPSIEYYFKQRNFKDEFEAKFWNGGLKEKIISLAMKNRWYFDSTYHYVYDSLELDCKKEIEQQIKTNPVSNDLLKLVANIGFKEAIPLLKNDLDSNRTHLYDPEMAELVLAKLGDKVLYKKILKECSYNNLLIDYDSTTGVESNNWLRDFNIKYSKLTFLETQESFYQLRSWLDTSKTCVNKEFSNGYIDFAYSANRILEQLYPLFGRYDLVKEWRKRNQRKSPETAAAILSFKKWMIQNKGKYVIKKQCPE